ncbi:MAG: class I SAM-dependent methyltransferase [Deltaproteobacteria bacterium CG17_big_fil_post_rev_8_21_14_2_50_51_6]|nr:methyltransferase domain-containing protein [bacterium]NCP08684.1 methyltransferase domain-containing protein [bacterium]PIW00973.1 MAG: class I SAM-dependent methyltransferase [Deltaproteobacteria bacterium CG17_big_fil_post_rev_8_21_14_2_50_51_6]PIY22606.1 MAG: class I SAM-dependent methyltransferase [Deltaproteobacteria bacterium CG_4_10_14_3_um_filter_51_14]
MREDKKFDPKHLDKLNNPERLNDIPVRRIWPVLEMEYPGTIVDIGAGTGFLSTQFAAYVTGGVLFACDLSDIMIDWIKENVSPIYKNIVPVKMEESRVPLDDAIADLVYMITLHHELDDPEAMLLECRRLLRENGKLLIIDWKKEEMKEGPPLKIRCLPEDVRVQLEEAGFGNVSQYDFLTKHFCLTAEK